MDQSKLMELTRLFIWLLFNIGFVASNNENNVGEVTCSSPCICNVNKRTATCNSRKLNYIPRLPSYVRTVKLVGNNFTHINRNFFMNITHYNIIRTLNLTDNKIVAVAEDAFADFRSLISLEVSKEPDLDITFLKKSFWGLPVESISFLQFSGNAWQYLPHDLFLPFSANKRETFTVSLTRNKLRHIDSLVFEPIKNICKLNLGWNEIKNVSIDRPLNVKELNLNGNYVLDIPNWCGPNNKTMVPNLLWLRLNDNSIAQMDQNSFKCLENLEKLGLDANNFRTLKSNTFSELRNLKKLYISENTRLKTIENFAFNISSLEVLNFSQNNFHFEKGIHYSYNPDTLFLNCPKLEYLYMSYNTIPSRNHYSTFQAIFRPLKLLKLLDLTGCSLRSLPYYTFGEMKQLEILNLKRNFLQGWNKSISVFGTNSSLKILNLRSNLIRLVNKTTFPNSLLKSLKKLDLGDNYFSCTCDQMWFRSWIRQNVESPVRALNLILVGYPNYYRCKLPGELRGKSLRDYNPTEADCSVKDPLLVTLVSVLSVAITSVIIIFVLYRCQTNVKNYIYMCRFYKNRKSGYIRLESEDYEYHAFIVYCEADSDWVHNTLVKKLEQEEEMKICIHHRDFDVGAPVTGNIDKYMSKCRKIIVVMSNNFAESEWCQWEIDLVHERRRRQGKDVSLLIMLRTIDSKHMTSRLKALLESTPYLTYCTGVGEQIFWKSVVKGLRKPFGHPPFAMV